MFEPRRAQSLRHAGSQWQLPHHGPENQRQEEELKRTQNKFCSIDADTPTACPSPGQAVGHLCLLIGAVADGVTVCLQMLTVPSLKLNVDFSAAKPGANHRIRHEAVMTNGAGTYHWMAPEASPQHEGRSLRGQKVCRMPGQTPGCC